MAGGAGNTGAVQQAQPFSGGAGPAVPGMPTAVQQPNMLAGGQANGGYSSSPMADRRPQQAGYQRGNPQLGNGPTPMGRAVPRGGAVSGQPNAFPGNNGGRAPQGMPDGGPQDGGLGALINGSGGQFTPQQQGIARAMFGQALQNRGYLGQPQQGTGGPAARGPTQFTPDFIPRR